MHCIAAHLRLANALLATATVSRSPLRATNWRRAALHVTRMQFDDTSPLGFEGNYGGGRPPSEKQVQYAQRLAQQTATELPQEALMDSDACSRFIDDALSRTPPSAKQVEYANTIARQLNMDMPPGVTASAKACSEFIDANQGLMGGMGGGGGGRNLQAGPGQAPSEKQILFAARLARERQLGLSAEALSDRLAMSQFIDACLNSQPMAAPAPASPTADMPSAMMAGTAAAGMATAAADAGGDDLEDELLFGGGGKEDPLFGGGGDEGPNDFNVPF